MDFTNLKRMVDTIEANKEILSSMPINNEKNIDKFTRKVEELEREYKLYTDQILDVLETRYNEQVYMEEDAEIEALNLKMQQIEDKLYLLDDKKTSYEKMELDKNIYKLAKYYKDNLDNVNSIIETCVKNFSDVGIELKIEDFKYTLYVTEYMEVFLEELKNNDIYSRKLKEKFEEIYWKCPDLIIQIELNFRKLYIDNMSAIDKFFDKERAELLKKWNKSPEKIKENYIELKRQKIEKKLVDKKDLINLFVSEKANVKNYTEDKVKANYLKIMDKEQLEENLKSKDLEENTYKFLNSLYEYRSYLEFKFIIDDMKKHYSEKTKSKKVHDDIKKQIDKSESKLEKLNNKIEGKGFFNKNKDTAKLAMQQDDLIKEIRELYKQLNINLFYQEIYTQLDDNSTLYDVLCLASDYYNYLNLCIQSYDKNIIQEDIDNKINKLRRFLNSPYNTIINNISILEDKDIILIIKDRYKLLNFAIEKEDLQENNLDSLISTLEEIQLGNNLRKSGIEISQIEELIEIKKLLRIKDNS